MVLISDLYEGGVREEMLRRARSLVESGVQLIALLLWPTPAPRRTTPRTRPPLLISASPTFACTPSFFPDLMAAAIRHEDITTWASTNLA